MFLCSLEKIDVDEALAYFERLDNGDFQMSVPRPMRMSLSQAIRL